MTVEHPPVPPWQQKLRQVDWINVFIGVFLVVFPAALAAYVGLEITKVRVNQLESKLDQTNASNREWIKRVDERSQLRHDELQAQLRREIDDVKIDVRENRALLQGRP